MEKVNVIVGRFQPFTLGHTKGAEYVFKEYNLKTVFCIIETPESKLDSKHPFTSDKIIEDNKDCREKWFAGMFPIKNADIGKIAKVCRDNGFEPVMWTCGSDRINAYKSQAVQKYIDMYNLDKDFKVVEIHRTDDDISATKVRAAIKSGDFNTYKRMMPEWSHDKFDSYKPFLKECSLHNFIKDTINEDFFHNIAGNKQELLDQEFNNIKDLSEMLIAYFNQPIKILKSTVVFKEVGYHIDMQVGDHFKVIIGTGVYIRCGARREGIVFQVCYVNNSNPTHRISYTTGRTYKYGENLLEWLKKLADGHSSCIPRYFNIKN